MPKTPGLMFAFLALGLWTSACNVRTNADVAAFGDSVTWGYGDLPGGWTRHLEQASGYTIANLGIPGEHARDGAGRMDLAMRTVPEAKTVFILHGGNDWVEAFQSSWCDRDCEPDVVDNHYQSIGGYLRQMRGAAAARGKTPVFLTYWPDAPGKCPKYNPEMWIKYQHHRARLNAEIVQVAGERGDHVVRLDDMGDFGDEANFFDCLHPSSSGYELIAKRILKDVDAWAPPDPSPGDLRLASPGIF